MSTPARQPAPGEEPEGSSRPEERPAGGRVWSALQKKHGRDVVADDLADVGREAERRRRQAEAQYRIRRAREEMFEQQARLLEGRLAEPPDPGTGSPHQPELKTALIQTAPDSTRGESRGRTGPAWSHLRPLLRRLRRLLRRGVG